MHTPFRAVLLRLLASQLVLFLAHLASRGEACQDGGRLDCRHEAGTTRFILDTPLAPPAGREASG